MYFEVSNGLILIDASINNQKGKYIFDTGLEGIIINGPAQRADEIFETVGGPVDAEKVKIDQLKVGNLIKSNLTAYQTDLSNVSSLMNTYVHGMIGLSVLEEVLVSIDYSTQTLKFIPKVPNINKVTDGMNHLNIIMQNDVPCIELKHNNESLLFALDTGAASHFLNENYADSPFTNSKAHKILAAGSTTISKGHIKLLLKNKADQAFNLSFKTINLSGINEQLDRPIHGILSIKKLFEGPFLIDTKLGLLYY